MNRLVYSVFKAIMVSIIFVFVFDMVFYIFKVTSLNSRMESLSTSLKKVVMDNNYLPSEQAEMYKQLFEQVIRDFNSVSSGYENSDSSQNFISGFHWNYGNDAENVNLSISSSRTYWTGSSWQTVSTDIVNKKMSTPGEYGDICVVQLRVGVYQPMWGWTTLAADGTSSGVDGNYDYDGQDATRWTRAATFRSSELVYTYYVPCLNYKTVTQSAS